MSKSVNVARLIELSLLLATFVSVVNFQFFFCGLEGGA
jgi:hypothetical protein